MSISKFAAAAESIKSAFWLAATGILVILPVALALLRKASVTGL